MGYSTMMLRVSMFVIAILMASCDQPRSPPSTVDVEHAAGASPSPPPAWSARAVALSVRAALVLGEPAADLDLNLRTLKTAELERWRAATDAALLAWDALPEADRAAALHGLVATVLGDLDELTDALSYSPAIQNIAEGPAEARIPTTAARLLEDQQIRAFKTVATLRQASASLSLEFNNPAVLADAARRTSLMTRVTDHASQVLTLQSQRLSGLALASTFMAPAERTEVGGGPLVARWLLLATGIAPTGAQ